MTITRLQNLATIFLLCFALGHAHGKLDYADHMMGRAIETLDAQSDLLDQQADLLDEEARRLGMLRRLGIVERVLR